MNPPAWLCKHAIDGSIDRLGAARFEGRGKAQDKCFHQQEQQPSCKQQHLPSRPPRLQQNAPSTKLGMYPVRGLPLSNQTSRQAPIDAELGKAALPLLVRGRRFWGVDAAPCPFFFSRLAYLFQAARDIHGHNISQKNRAPIDPLNPEAALAGQGCASMHRS